MKKLMNSLAACLLLAGASPLPAQRLTTLPEKPMPGETLTLRYDPAGSPLEGLASFETTAYLFEGGDPKAVEVALQPDGKAFTGSLATTAGTKAVLFSFKNEEEGKVDANGDKGFKVLFCQADRTTPVQGACVAKSLIFSNYARFGNIKRDPAKAFELLEREFETHSASKREEKLFQRYAELAFAQKSESALAQVKAEADRLSSVERAGESELWQAFSLCSAIQDNARRDLLDERMKKEFPEGKAVKAAATRSFADTKDLTAKAAIFEQVKAKWGKDEGMDAFLGNWAATLASLHGQNKDWANFEKWLALVQDKPRKAGALNGVAWKLAGEGLEGESDDPQAAKKYSALSLQLLREEMDNPSGKPSYYTSRQWKSNLENSYAMFADTYAVALHRTGDAEEALKFQQAACDKSKFKDGEMNERYCVYLEKAKGGKEAEAVLENLVAEGAATMKMKEQHKRLFVAGNTLESAYEKYLVKLEEKALDRLKEELKSKMLDQPAAAFRLLNLKGEEVSLESLKGKVVVLDFWATWCGPCKASFPAMQRAVNAFASNGDVQFLFVDTWEKVEDKQKNAAEFIESKKYTFNVLLDDKSEVVAAYGVDGIPTKFVLDGRGVIRFKSTGFGGNDDELVKELTLMIEMAGGSAPKLSGAP